MAKDDEIRDILFVRTLGGFSVTLNGKLIAGGSKAKGSQYQDLLMILIHNAEKGVPRDQLEEFLFEYRDLDNMRHALQSVIYNSKKKLKSLGLPDAENAIIQKKGVFYWNSALPVKADARDFEASYNEAARTVDPEKKLEAYLKAVSLYSGEFLPNLTASIWAMKEATRLKAIFYECVEDAAGLLRESQDHFRLRDLGVYAAKIDPLSDWETLTMEALVALGKYDEARQLYDDTVAYYINEQGIRPSKSMMEKFSQLSNEMMHRHEVLDLIQVGLSGMSDQSPGGYLCSYPIFTGIYQMVERMMERGGQSVFLMLCTVVDSKGNPVESGEKLSELSQRMVEAVRHSVRRGDALCRYGNGQVLVLLVNTSRENCDIIQRRINKHFIIGRQRIGIQDYGNSVFWTPQMPEETSEKDRKGEDSDG